MTRADRLNRIHEDVLEGEVAAPLAVFQEALGPLAGMIRRRFPGFDGDRAHDIATDAILLYLEDPRRCDTSKGSLWALLCTIAMGDAQDAARRDRRRGELQPKADRHVELWNSHANERESAESGIDARRIMEKHGDRLIRDARDEQLLGLILDDEKSTARFAEALGLDPRAETTEREVKRAKDRMLLRLKRLAHGI